MQAPRIWLLTGPRPGERSQQRQLAEALGEPYLDKPVFRPGAGPIEGFGWTPEQAERSGLVAPWPAVVISFGKTLTAALWVRAASGGRTRIVHLGRPGGTAVAALDLILPMPQDTMPEAPNVLPLRMPLNAPPQPLPGALQSARQRLARLPKPWTLLVVGGSTEHFELDQQTLADIVQQLSAELQISGGSLLVSTSPRTAQALLPPLQALLLASGRPHELNLFDPAQTSNAYAEYLHLADEMVVTGDTASMIADGWRSGCPLRVVVLPATRALRLQRALRCCLPKVLIDALVRRGLWSAAVDLDQWIAALAAEGTVGIFGRSAATRRWSAAADDDLQRAAKRIQQLLPPAAGWVLWKLKKADPAVASVRYRCLLPVLANETLSRRSVIVDGDQPCSLDGVSALIFVKTFSAADVALAKAAAARGLPIYFDLCDNIFAEGYGGKGGAMLRERFMAIAALATGIVTNGSSLSAVLREQLPAAWHQKLDEQPDMIETEHLVRQAITPALWPNRDVARRLAGPTKRLSLGKQIRRHWARLRKSLVRRPGALPTVLWFGNSSSGGGNQGLAALAECLPQLRAAFKRSPFQLLVVSNDRPLYRQLIAGQGLPARFEPWSALGIFDALKSARACLVPALKNGFNRGKSANRLVMALAHGVPVIASSIEIYQPFSDCVVLDDFESGLVAYLDDEATRQQALHVFKLKHWPQYQPQRLAERWLQRLNRV